MTDKKSKKQEQLEEIFGKWDGEYVGNMFGWKTSLIGLAILLSLLALMLYRHYQIGDWNMMTEEERMELTR